MLNDTRQSGFTLVETMVTVFVVAIGLLTAAVLQAASKKATYEATQRTVATTLAQDIIERMRANYVNASSNLAAYATASSGLSAANPPTAPSCGDASSPPCTAQQQAQFDLYNWWQALDGASETITSGGSTSNVGGLSDVTGCITVPATPGNQVQVTIAWRGLTAVYQNLSQSDPNDPTSSLCGASNPAYADDAGSGRSNFLYRRVLVISATLHG